VKCRINHFGNNKQIEVARDAESYRKPVAGGLRAAFVKHIKANSFNMKRIEEHEKHYMKLALELAAVAAQNGDSPVGAVIVLDGAILGTGFNSMERLKDPTAHAEILAIREAAKSMSDWRLPGATIYATLEPCVMCAGALIHARVKRVVFGARDLKWGGLGSLFDFSHDPRINHELEVISGIMERESAALLQSFFRTIRTGSPDTSAASEYPAR
jgi:tRNA(adenine34) deaminase